MGCRNYDDFPYVNRDRETYYSSNMITVITTAASIISWLGLIGFFADHE